MTLMSLLALAFAPAVQLTGANHFWDRERGSAILAAWWPLSEPALEFGRLSSDMEVRKRCRATTPTTWRSDLAAAALVSHRGERDGLPLADGRYVCFGCDLRASVIRLAKAHGIDTSCSYYFGESEFWQSPTGYDYVRLRLRGIRVGGPADWTEADKARMRNEWSALKGR